MSIRRIGVVLGTVVAVAVIGFVAIQVLQYLRPPMTFTAEGDRLIVNGTTGSDSLADLEAALAAHPETEVIVLNRVEGSDDDAVNLQMARAIRDRELDTHLNKDSIIESGGIELFIGGVNRTMNEGARIGVHSWFDEDEKYQGRDLPKDHPDHQPYLETYRALGVPEDLYWFILAAASSDGMYFMTEADIGRFDILTEPIGEKTQTNLTGLSSH
jgi:hypothetical protein